MLSITNSTLAFNRAVGGDAGFNVLGAKQRGGDGIGGGIWGSAGSLSLTHLTLAGNTASGGAGTRLAAPPGPDGVGNGGGIFNTNGAMTLVNTIIANSLSGSNCFGIITDGGGNISSDGSCSFSAPGSLNNTDPVLGLLGDYGGPTPTIPLLAGSPAIDRANTAFCPSSDQRGRTRPSGTGCDIGALESSPPYTIRGQITGFGISGGIEVKLNTSSTVTDNDRNYALNDFAPATYTVLPVSSELVFIPHDRVITVGPDSVANDFKAYRLNYLSSEPSSNAIQHCVFAGTNGQAHEIQVSTNLVNWLPIATNTVDARGIFEYFYTNSATDRMRFLRTKKQP
jgi:hypothetical protein